MTTTPVHPTEPAQGAATGPDEVHQLRDSHLRSVFKAVSWHIIGTIDTMVISYFWIGHAGKALGIGGTEVVTKIGLYYLHERAWALVPLGTMRRHSPFPKEEPVSQLPLRDSNLRSLLKAVSWRIVGTIDTILVSYFWTGDARKALVIGASEVITKIVLYYLHERAWARIPLGTLRRIFRIGDGQRPPTP